MAQETIERIINPLTGEVLDDDLQTLAQAEIWVDRYLRSQSRHYRFRGDLRKRIAELRGPAELPRRRDRTDKQMKVAECPRCGEELVAS